ncbi:MAG: Ig-like domain-containing protein, partial [candidate division WOR-3 bacterium]
MRLCSVVRGAAGVLAVLALLVVLFSACVVDILDPTVHILWPRDGGVVAGEVEVRYVATDDRGVRRIELYVDDELRDTVSNPESDTVTYLLDLMATGKDTSHTIRIEATDAAENRGQSQVTFFGYGRLPPAPVMLLP